MEAQKILNKQKKPLSVIGIMTQQLAKNLMESLKCVMKVHRLPKQVFENRYEANDLLVETMERWIYFLDCSQILDMEAESQLGMAEMVDVLICPEGTVLSMTGMLRHTERLFFRDTSLPNPPAVQTGFHMSANLSQMASNPQSSGAFNDAHRFFEYLEDCVPLLLDDEENLSGSMMVRQIRSDRPGGDIALVGRMEYGNLDGYQPVVVWSPEKECLKAIKSLNVLGRQVKVAKEGDIVECTLRGVDLGDIKPGQIIASSTLPLHSHMECSIHYETVDDAQSYDVIHGMKALLQFKWGRVPGKVVCDASVKRLPHKGALAVFYVELDSPVAVKKGDLVTIKINNRTPRHGRVERIMASRTDVISELGMVKIGEEVNSSVYGYLDLSNNDLDLTVIKTIYMGSTPVTFQMVEDYLSDASELNRLNDEGWGRGDRPVIYMSWYNARGFCRGLSRKTGFRFRLPSAKEWEYACLGGMSYAEFEYKTKKLRINGNVGKHQKTTPVARYRPNGYELYDMPGNVWEWCEDSAVDSKFRQHVPNGSGNPVLVYSNSLRAVQKGGSWATPKEEWSPFIERGRYKNQTDNETGFRIVMEA